MMANVWRQPRPLAGVGCTAGLDAFFEILPYQIPTKINTALDANRYTAKNLSCPKSEITPSTVKMAPSNRQNHAVALVVLCVRVAIRAIALSEASVEFAHCREQTYLPVSVL